MLFPHKISPFHTVYLIAGFFVTVILNQSNGKKFSSLKPNKMLDMLLN